MSIKSRTEKHLGVQSSVQNIIWRFSHNLYDMPRLWGQHKAVLYFKVHFLSFHRRISSKLKVYKHTDLCYEAQCVHFHYYFKD